MAMVRAGGKCVCVGGGGWWEVGAGAGGGEKGAHVYLCRQVCLRSSVCLGLSVFMYVCKFQLATIRGIKNLPVKNVKLSVTE